MDGDPGGMTIAAVPGVARRTGAMIGIVVLIALALMLVWRVYLHHERTDEFGDEPALVRKNFQPPQSKLLT